MFVCLGLRAGRCQDNDQQNIKRRAYEKQRSRSFDLILGGGYNPCLWSPVEEHRQLTTSKFESISSEEGHATDYTNLPRDNKDETDGGVPSRKLMPHVLAQESVEMANDQTGRQDMAYSHGHWTEPGLDQRGRGSQGVDIRQDQRTDRNILHDKRVDGVPLRVELENRADCCSVELTRKASPNMNRVAVMNDHQSRRRSSVIHPFDVESERRVSVLPNCEKRAPLLRQVNALPQNVKSGRRESSAGRRESSAGRRESSARVDGSKHESSSSGRRDSCMGRQLPQIPQEHGDGKQRRLLAFHEKKSHSLDSSFEDYVDENEQLNYGYGRNHCLSVQQRRSRMMHEKSYSLDVPYVAHDFDVAEHHYDPPRHASYGDTRMYTQVPVFEHRRAPTHDDVNSSSEHLRAAPRSPSRAHLVRSATINDHRKEQGKTRNHHSPGDRSSHDKRTEHSSQKFPGAEIYNVHRYTELDTSDGKRKKSRETITSGEAATSSSSHSRHAASQSRNPPQEISIKSKKITNKSDLQKTRIDPHHKSQNVDKAPCEKSDGTQDKSGAHKTAQEKRIHQFRQQKSYSYEMPYELERHEHTAEGQVTAHGQRRKQFHQQKSHSCEVPCAAPPSSAHNEAVWMEREQERRYMEAEGYAPPSPARSPQDTVHVATSDALVRSPGNCPPTDNIPRLPRETCVASGSKTAEGKRFKNLEEREADFWKRKRQECYQQQRSSSLAVPSRYIDKNFKSREPNKNKPTVTDTFSQMANQHTGDKQSQLQQDAINVEVMQERSRSTRMQRFRQQKSQSLNVDSCTPPPLTDNDERRRSASSHAPKHDAKSSSSNNHKLMTLHSMKSIRTDDHVHNTGVGKHKTKHGASDSGRRDSLRTHSPSGNRDDSRTHSPHSSVPRPVNHGVTEEPTRASGRRHELDSATTKVGNGAAHKTSAEKLATGIRKGCCIAPAGESSDFSESFEHQSHCTMTRVVCHENCTDDVVERSRGAPTLSACPDENITGKYRVWLMVFRCAGVFRPCCMLHGPLVGIVRFNAAQHIFRLAQIRVYNWKHVCSLNWDLTA